MRNVWKGMVMGALIGAGLDAARIASERGKELGVTATEQGRALAHNVSDRLEAADLSKKLEDAASTARDKVHDVVGRTG